jgi:hypothetical protein
VDVIVKWYLRIMLNIQMHCNYLGINRIRLFAQICDGE